MAESPSTEKQDSLEDSLSSEEWTIIYKKESKSKDAADEKTDSEKPDESKETMISEDAYKVEESTKTEAEHIEEGVEAGEKAIESDDVSILSDESEPEHVVFEEGRIERIEWQVERKPSVQSRAVAPTTQSDGIITANALITCSVVALIFGIIIACQIVEFRADKPISYTGNTEIEDKLRELSGIEEKLKELNDVRNALEQIQISMPEMKNLKDQLTYQKYEKNKASHLIEDYKNLEKLNLQNLLNLNTHNDRLELLGTTYQNFCSTIKRINSSSSAIENELCETPKILSDMIVFKKNLRKAFQQTQDIMSPEKRILDDAEKKLDSVSDSLLSEMTVMFSRFSLKVQERLNKFGYKLNKRLCSMSNTGRTNDKFFNILLDKDFYINNCNETSNADAVVLDSTTDIPYKKEKNHGMKKRSYEELKKNGHKYDYKNSKDYKQIKDSREYHSEKEYNKEIYIEKSKGEVKNGNNWKNNKYENKDKHSDEKKYKHEKPNENLKNENNKKVKEEREFESFLDNKVKEHHHDRKFEYNQKDNDYDRKSENHKKERDYDNKFEQYKKDNDFNKKFEHKKEHGFDQKVEYHKKDNFDRKYDHNKKERNYDKTFGNKRNFVVYDDDDSKFIILENDGDEFVTSNEFQPKFKKEKEFPQRPDSYKESKYTKYTGNDRKDNKKDKYQPSGDWQMQRGKAREKLRNSDWYFVRADSRQKARIVEDNNDLEVGEEAPWSPPRPHKKRQQHDHHHRTEKDNDDHSQKSQARCPAVDNLRKRVLRTVGRSWEFLNAKLRKYF
ncbi:uncharacterized protein LOC100678818 isoform X1 [Nasonia vitripennis]|uniref:Uncharacterized protein n=1 Tax=Nasonia vitripennis TaxID=7425 RepID=A0A7M7R2F9_NASVI|nr:uncharacterized protein LOC100678818 isoform X1 [Nasonia vitripennis]XP_008208870.1 uncharacterized protein LOC100678818 isoform X1 [Nasonia vitripennis]XP_016840846.1 uncharacterized protein LOC100678818 isoform X1 [Nasonia vitripennis]XP_032458197.1 uncharacterized protein LOC100678818 isoform X1 [Nasonia vitripennis]